MKILKSAALIAAGLLALAGCQKSVDTVAVSDHMKKGVRDWVAAYSAGDADTIAAMYAEDAVVMAPGAPAARGREAIRTFIASDSANAKAAGVTIVISDGDETGVIGDLGWHSGAYTITDASGAVIDSGNYLEVQQNIDGKWVIVRDIWNSDQPPPAPAAEPAAEAASEPAAG